jgi:hypothetical protein
VAPGESENDPPGPVARSNALDVVEAVAGLYGIYAPSQ